MKINPDLNAILAAPDTTALNNPLNDLISKFNNSSGTSLLSDLRIIADTMRQRIARIRELQDLGAENVTFEQRPGVKIINWFGQIAQGLARYGAYPTAINLLIDLWNEFGEYQLTLNEQPGVLKTFYRAGIGMYLGQLCLQYGEQGDAFWWLLHAYADDLLCGQLKDEGAAHDLLRLAFGVGDSVFEYMNECKNSNSKAKQKHTLFAEHLVTQLALNSQFVSLFSYPSSRSEFPIGRAYAKTMFSRMGKTNTKGNLEGETLEEFVRYLVLLVTGWVPTKNMYHPRTKIDSDVVARYIREPESISSSHSRAILIECKNIKDTLNVAKTGYFLYRMNLTQVDVGVLFAPRNVSGTGQKNKDHNNARHLLDLAFQQNGTAVVVIDSDDLKDITTGKKTLWTLIDSGIVARRFGTPKKGKI